MNLTVDKIKTIDDLKYYLINDLYDADRYWHMTEGFDCENNYVKHVCIQGDICLCELFIGTTTRIYVNLTEYDYNVLSDRKVLYSFNIDCDKTNDKTIELITMLEDYIGKPIL